MRQKNHKKDADTISPRILWPAAILFALAFIFASYNLYKTIIYSYPANDFGDHLAQIKSTYEYGTSKPIPYWNNGNFYAGRVYGMSWYVSGAMINHLTHDARISFIILELLLYIIGFLGVWAYCKVKGYPARETFLFYALFFFSPLTVAYFLGLGSVGVLFGWAFMFFLLAILEYYKDRPIDRRFLFITPFYLVIILSHMYMAIISSIIVASFALRKFIGYYDRSWKNSIKEILLIISPAIVCFILSSFWWIDYIRMYDVINKIPPFQYHDFNFMMNVAPRGMIFTFIIPIIFLALYFINYRTFDLYRKILYSVPAAISILMLIRVLAFIPIIGRLGFESLCLYIWVFSMIILFDDGIPLKKMRWTRKMKSTKRVLIKKLLAGCIILFTVLLGAFFAYVYYYSNSMKLTPRDQSAITLVESNLKNIDNLVVMYDWPEMHNPAYNYTIHLPVHVTLNGYMTLEHDTVSAQSVLWQAMDDSTYFGLIDMKESLKRYDCESFVSTAKTLRIKNILFMDFDCEKIKGCSSAGLEFIAENKQSGQCLFYVE